MQAGETTNTPAMELILWGVRGTLPVCGPGSLRYGGNTPCVSVRLDNDQLMIFDAGTGIRSLSKTLEAKGGDSVKASIFISHPHWDHINALPFFLPLYKKGNEIDIYGASQGEHREFDIHMLISAQMDGIYFPITLQAFNAEVSFHTLEEETLQIGEATVRSLRLNHPGYCLGYRVEYAGRSLCYVTDNELYLPDHPHYDSNYVKRLQDFVRDCDVLITDCTYMDDEYLQHENWGHSAISQVVKLAHEAEVKELFLFHHDPDQDDDAIDRKLAAAKDGLKKLKSKTKCTAPVEEISFHL